MRPSSNPGPGGEPRVIPWTADQGILALVAGMFDYPGLDPWPRWAAIARQAGQVFPAAGGKLAGFLAEMEKGPEEAESVFLRTFEICPVCSLHVAIHLFGEENYQRARFMARLGEACQAAGMQSARELPDHLASILRYFGAAAEDERQDLVRYCLLGPLRQMIGLLGGGKENGAGDAVPGGNPFRLALEAVELILRALYPHLQAAPMPSARRRTDPCLVAAPVFEVKAGCAGNCVGVRETAVQKRW